MSIKIPLPLTVEYTDNDDLESVRIKIIEELDNFGLFSEELLFCGVHTRRKLADLLGHPEPHFPMDPGFIQAGRMLRDGSLVDSDDPVHYAVELQRGKELSYVLVYRDLIHDTNYPSYYFRPIQGKSFRDHLLVVFEIK